MATNRGVLSEHGPQITARGHYGDLEVVRVDVTNGKAFFRSRLADGSLGIEEDTRLSLVQPLSREDTTKFWKMLVDDLMGVFRKESKLPAFVKGYEVEIGDDSTGDPSLYVTILVPPEKQYSPETVSRWNSFSNLLLDRLTGLRLRRYPYVQIGEKRRNR